MEELIRLQKYLADLGVGSRRKCETYIQEGLIAVNGVLVTKLGTKIDPSRDKVQYNKKLIKQKKKTFRTIMLYKPRGYVCTTSSKEGRVVKDLLKSVQENVVTIGRLDKKSEGLLLLSNDGELVYRLSHPSFGHQKIYQVMVSGELTKELLKRLNLPMKIDGYITKPARVRLLRPGEKSGRTLLEFTLTEGRNLQIRKMCETEHLEVHRLTRVQIGKLKLRGLKPGQWQELDRHQLELLNPPGA